MSKFPKELQDFVKLMAARAMKRDLDAIRFLGALTLALAAKD